MTYPWFHPSPVYTLHSPHFSSGDSGEISSEKLFMEAETEAEPEPKPCILRGYIDADVVGMRYYLSEDGPFPTPSEVLSFRREPLNSADINAIAVTYPKLDYLKIGYLPRYYAAILAPILDVGAAFARLMVPFAPKFSSKKLSSSIPCQILLFANSGTSIPISIPLHDTSSPNFVLYPRFANINLTDFDDMVARQTGTHLARACPIDLTPVPARVPVRVQVPPPVPIRVQIPPPVRVCVQVPPPVRVQVPAPVPVRVQELPAVPVRSREEEEEEEMFRMMENEPLVMNGNTNNVKSAKFANIMDAINFLSKPLDPNLEKLSLLDIAAMKGIKFPEPYWWYPSGEGGSGLSPIERTNENAPGGSNEDQP